MSFEIQGLKIGTETADADCSAKQYYGVKFTSTGFAVCSTLGEDCDGVLQDNPASGAVGCVQVSGVTKMVANAAIAKGARVSIAATGKATTALTTHYVFGRALEASTAGDQVIAVLITKSAILP